MTKSPYDANSIEEAYDAINRQTKTRQQKTLSIIHQVCKDYADRGGADFTIANISRLGNDKKVPKEQSLRHPSADSYRALIKAWSEHTQKTQKKVRVRGQYDWVERIEEPDIIFLVKDLINENLSLKKEIRLCKDFKSQFNHDGILDVTIKSQQTMNLKQIEWDALRKLLDSKELRKRGLSTDERGRLFNSDGEEILPIGFITAIEKIIAIDMNEA